MKYSVVTIMLVIGLFIITQFVGLAVNNHYLGEELPFGLKPPEVDTQLSPMFFVGMIIIVTLMFFILKRMNLVLLMKSWFFLAFTVGITVSLASFVDPVFAIFAAVAITLLKFYEHDIYTHNIAEVFLYGGIVSLFVPILNLWTVIILLIIISVYDFISVFITKHMVQLAKMQESLGIFSGLIVTYKNELAILGGGDIAFTMLFATVLLRDFGFVPAFLAIFGATAGIAVLMLMGKKKKFYPAMPFVTIGSLLGFGLTLLF